MPLGILTGRCARVETIMPWLAAGSLGPLAKQFLLEVEEVSLVFMLAASADFACFQE